MKYGNPWIVDREKYRLMRDDEWRPWFAWYPVRFKNGQKAWLETVEYNKPMRFNLPNYREMKA